MAHIEKNTIKIFFLCVISNRSIVQTADFFYLTFSTIWFVCCQTNRRNWLVVCKRQNNKNSNRLRQLLCISHACYTHRDICYYEHSVRIEEKQSNNIQQFSRYIALTHTHIPLRCIDVWILSNVMRVWFSTCRRFYFISLFMYRNESLFMEQFYEEVEKKPLNYYSAKKVNDNRKKFCSRFLLLLKILALYNMEFQLFWAVRISTVIWWHSFCCHMHWHTFHSTWMHVKPITDIIETIIFI